MKKVVVTYQLVPFASAVDPASFEKALEASRSSPAASSTRTCRTRRSPSATTKLRSQAFVHTAPVEVPQRDATMQVDARQGHQGARRRSRGTDSTLESFKVNVPGLYNYLKIASAQVQVVDNARNEPEQVIVIETSIGVSEAEMKKNVEAWVLPAYDPSDAEEPKHKRKHRWSDAEQIGPEILKKGSKLSLEPLASEKEYSTLHSFRFKGEVGRYVYVSVKKGLRGFGGYLLGDAAIFTAEIPVFPRQLRILHSGALLSLAGEKKVSLFARDVPGVHVEISRVLPDQLQHFVSQAGGDYAHPSFSWTLVELPTTRPSASPTIARTSRRPATGKADVRRKRFDRSLPVPRRGRPRRGVFF